MPLNKFAWVSFAQGQCGSKIVHLMLRTIHKYEQACLIFWQFHDPLPNDPMTHP